eukprot:2372848-Rhodomonas_salina.3
MPCYSCATSLQLTRKKTATTGATCGQTRTRVRRSTQRSACIWFGDRDFPSCGRPQLTVHFRTGRFDDRFSSIADR